MNQSIFSILSTYKPTEDINPEENYSTELLVYLLNNSLQRKSPLFSVFMEKLTNNVVSPESYPQFNIATQRLFFTSRNEKAFPDITIESDEHYYFIEVKVESGINYYQVNNEDESITMINQIQKYQDISINPDKSKSVFLLTKYAHEMSFENCPDFKSHLKWSEVYKLIESYQEIDDIENYLISEMKKYMEEKGMAILKVSYELIKGMESLNNLFSQLEIILEGIPNAKSFGAEWLGYYIVLNGKKPGWVGTYYEGNRLVFEHHDEKVVNYLKNNPNQIKGELKKKDLYITYFDFEENHYFCLNAEGQLDMMKKWINDNYKLIKELL